MHFVSTVSALMMLISCITICFLFCALPKKTFSFSTVHNTKSHGVISGYLGSHSAELPRCPIHSSNLQVKEPAKNLRTVLNASIFWPKALFLIHLAYTRLQ